MAVFDARYRFIMVDIGKAGRTSDSGIFAASQSGLDIDENLINYPNNNCVNLGYDNNNVKFPYVFS